MRATAGLTYSQKQVGKQDKNEMPPRKKIHKRHADNLIVDKEALLAEANEWNEDHKVNWSALATRYGLSTYNRGQIIKEFLAENGISACIL